jgi:hypothetical protein
VETPYTEFRTIRSRNTESTSGGWRSWLRHCATSRKVADSIPDIVTGTFHLHNPSGRTMALGSTQPLTEMSTRNISWGAKGGRCVGLTTLPPSCADCLQIWEPQPPGILMACPGLQWDWFTFTFILRVQIYKCHRSVLHKIRAFSRNMCKKFPYTRFYENLKGVSIPDAWRQKDRGKNVISPSGVPVLRKERLILELCKFCGAQITRSQGRTQTTWVPKYCIAWWPITAYLNEKLKIYALLRCYAT